MPTLVWTLKIDGADPAPIRSLQAALDALKASAASVGGAVGGAFSGSGAATAAAATLALQTAQERLNAAAAATLQAELRLDQQLTRNATSIQQLASATNNAQASQTRATTAGEQLQRAQNQVQQSATQAATAAERLAGATAQTEAAESRAAIAAIRLQEAQTRLAQGHADVGHAAETHGPKLVSFFQNALAAATGFLAANVFQHIVSGLASVGGSVITTAGDMERMRAGFTTMLGSAQQADILIKQLQAEANRSPFELKNFQDGARMLLGIGTAADQIVPRLHEVSNVVAALGGGTAQFDRIMQQLGQIQTKGKAQGEDLRTLAQDGVPVWKILADAMNVTKARAEELATQGKITSEMWDQAFSKFANSGQITAAADAQSHTFQGLLSTIHDIGASLSTAFGEPMLRAIEPTLERIVTGLQDPAVVATLAQWGAAAGQFVTGLINAGTVAFQVGGEIVAALKPVFDAIGQFFGLSGGPTLQMPAAPDFSQLASDTTKIKDGLQQAADPTKAIKEQIKEAELAQRAETRAAQETELSYSHQSEAIQDKIKALQAAYDLENRTTSRADLLAKIKKDEALAVDVVSAQGQAAAKRLVTEKEQLAQMDRKNAFDDAKAGLEAQKSVIDDKLKATREANAQAARDTQAHIDDLRAKLANTPLPTITGGGGTGPPGPIKPDPAIAAATSQYAQFYSSTGAQAQSWGSKIRKAVDDLITKLHQLGGAPGAVLGAVLDDWNLLTGAFDGIGAHVSPILSTVSNLINTLGGRDGLEGVFIAVGFEFQRLMASIAAVTPVILRQAGAMFGEFGGEINMALASVNQIAAAIKLQLGTGTQAEYDAARKATQAAQYQFAIEHERNKQAGSTGIGDFNARIAQINADIDRQQAAAFAAADARAHPVVQGPQRPPRPGEPGYIGPVAPPRPGQPGYIGPVAPSGYLTPGALPTQSTGTADSHIHVTVSADQHGLLTAVAHVVTGPFVAQQLGNYAASTLG